jgi:hypothetical protein
MEVPISQWEKEEEEEEDEFIVKQSCLQQDQ